MSDRPMFKECMKLFLENSYGFAFEKYNGTLALARIDVDGTTVGTIEDSDLILKSNRPSVKVSYTDIKDVITGIVIKYQKVIPEDNYYAQVSYCYRISSTETSKHNWTLLDTNGNWQFYSGLLQDAYEARGSENILTIEADGIRDAGTAERLARAIVLQRWQSMAIIELDCIYSCLKYEIGDQVDTDIAILESVGLNGKIYLVTKTKVVPTIGGNPHIALKLLQIGSASLPDALVWQDTYSTGDAKQNTFSTGDSVIGVY